MQVNYPNVRITYDKSREYTNNLGKSDFLTNIRIRSKTLFVYSYKFVNSCDISMLAVEKIARILRTDRDVVQGICDKMCALTGKKDVLEKIAEENDKKIKESLEALGLSGRVASFEVYQALINKIRKDDEAIFELFRSPRCIDYEGCKTLLNFASELADVGEGFFLKREKAEEFLRENPPQNIIRNLGYKDSDELLKNEDVMDIFCALRFSESSQWLNDVFFQQYENLEPEDFEERKIELKVLGNKWLELAKKFLEKKYHNISHLKELGIIFMLPIELRVPGETLRSFSLLLHYFHEVDFYSKLFQKYAKIKDAFAKKLISSLRGDVLEGPLPNEGKISWRIVQRYLAKDDEYDHRLFEPHIDPEAVHWTKVENDIARLSQRFEGLSLDFWQDLDFVGDYFKAPGGSDILVSFNLIDTVMSLVMEKEMIKYLYHHQEAMWNKIFIEYIGQEEMERLIVENLDKGYISL